MTDFDGRDAEFLKTQELILNVRDSLQRIEKTAGQLAGRQIRLRHSMNEQQRLTQESIRQTQEGMRRLQESTHTRRL